MFKPYELLESILLDIENNIKNDINTSVLCKKYGISNSYLRSLFNFAFNQSIAAYIRSRKLAASLNDILETDSNIINIAIDYGFEYEQSYIRSFQREFGITPGNLRKTGHILKIKPPLQLLDENKLGDDGVFFGLDIVLVPTFYFIGKRHRIPYEKIMEVTPGLAKQFMDNEHTQIKGVVNPYVYIGISSNANPEEKHCEYTTSVQVKNLKSIPNGFCGDTFETTMCARIRCILHYNNSDFNKDIVSKMSNGIQFFTQNEKIKYELSVNKIYLQKIDTRLYDGAYFQMEWFTPVTIKQ